MRPIVLIISLASLLTAAVCRLPATPPEEIPAPAPQGKPPDAKFLGPQSCMATACHGKSTYDGSGGERLTRGAEYVFWRDFDPHARGGVTLLGEPSRKMLARLGIDAPQDVAQSCGVCHSPTPAAAETGRSFVAGQGVGCESCHGPAGGWRNTHFRNAPSSNAQSRNAPSSNAGAAATAARAASPPGMTDTKSLAVRAEVCAGCHVGSPGRLVDHRLIAAGHPVLQFEMASHHARLPRHWDEAEDRGRHRSMETQLWAHGQRALLRHALRQWRQAGSGPPDLAALDCYGCHHDLGSGAWQSSPPAAAQRPLGRMSWRPWDHAIAVAACGEERWEQAVDELAAMILQRRWDEAASAAAALDRQLAGAECTARPAEVLAGVRRRLGDTSLPWTWDAAAQSYLALVAVLQDLRPALRQQQHSAAVGQLQLLRSQLQFPAGRASPSAPEAAFSPPQIRRRLAEVAAALQPAADASAAAAGGLPSQAMAADSP